MFGKRVASLDCEPTCVRNRAHAHALLTASLLGYFLLCPALEGFFQEAQADVLQGKSTCFVEFRGALQSATAIGAVKPANNETHPARNPTRG